MRLIPNIMGWYIASVINEINLQLMYLSFQNGKKLPFQLRQCVSTTLPLSNMANHNCQNHPYMMKNELFTEGKNVRTRNQHQFDSHLDIDRKIKWSFHQSRTYSVDLLDSTVVQYNQQLNQVYRQNQHEYLIDEERLISAILPTIETLSHLPVSVRLSPMEVLVG